MSRIRSFVRAPVSAAQKAIDDARIGEAEPIAPQEGPQERFARCTADIAIYGGSAGAGKTFAELMEPLYHVGNPQFRCVIFRREYVQITNAGGLWDESMTLYPQFGCKSLSGDLTHTFPSGARVEFAHLNRESSVQSWQGAQIPLIQFDELTHFTQGQFFYMLSRNRSTCGVKPYVRGTCNPDADSWVATFIAWWIDQETGLFIPERSGVIRWMLRVGGDLHWGDSREALIKKFYRHDLPPNHVEQPDPKSVTFIGASIFDNKKLMEKDPGYLANLKAMPLVERERLLGGNWKIRKSAGLYFKRQWVTVVPVPPSVGQIDYVRAWDLAATTEQEGTDPDWTVGTLLARQKLDDNVRFYVCSRVKLRGTPLEVERLLMSTATADGKRVRIRLPQDPGQAGKSQARRFVAMLAGFNVTIEPVTGEKTTRFGPFSAQCEAGNVAVVAGTWNDDWFDCLEGFPEAKHDDDADSVADAFNLLMAAPRYGYAGQLVSAVNKHFGASPL